MNTLTRSEGAPTGIVRTWLQAEGMSILTLSMLLYWYFGSNWWIFIGLLLIPDLSMLPYFFNPRIGSLSYNMVHSYSLPLGLAAVAVAVRRFEMLPFLCTWTAHIGMDRFLGFGLKYPTAFAQTHLGPLGPRRSGLESLVRLPSNGR